MLSKIISQSESETQTESRVNESDSVFKFNY